MTREQWLALASDLSDARDTVGRFADAIRSEYPDVANMLMADGGLYRLVNVLCLDSYQHALRMEDSHVA